MMEQIGRDVMRTHPDMHFFSGSDCTAETHRNVSFKVPIPQVPKHLALRAIQYRLVCEIKRLHLGFSLQLAINL